MSELTDLFCMTLPKSTTLCIKDSDGTILIEEDAIILDMLLSECRGDLDLKSSVESRIRWLQLVADALNHRYGCNLTIGQAMEIIARLSVVMLALKKNQPDSPTSPSSSPESSDPSPQS